MAHDILNDPQARLMAATAGVMEQLAAPVPEIRFSKSYWESVNREMDEWRRQDERYGMGEAAYRAPVERRY